HLLIFCAVFLSAALAERLLRRCDDFRLRYACEFALLTMALWWALQRLVGKAIGLDDGWGDAATFGLSVTLVATWAAIRLERWAHASMRLTSGFDVFFGPARSGGVGGGTVVSLLVTALAAYVLSTVAGRLDWDFLLLKLGVLAVWIVTFSQIYRAAS